MACYRWFRLDCPIVMWIRCNNLRLPFNLMWFANLIYPGPHTQPIAAAQVSYLRAGLRLMMLSCAGVCRKQRVATTSARSHRTLLAPYPTARTGSAPAQQRIGSEQSGGPATARQKPDRPVVLMDPPSHSHGSQCPRPHLPGTRSPLPAIARSQALQIVLIDIVHLTPA